jgi:hypothetical protein
MSNQSAEHDQPGNIDSIHTTNLGTEGEKPSSRFESVDHGYNSLLAKIAAKTRDTGDDRVATNDGRIMAFCSSAFEITIAEDNKAGEAIQIKRQDVLSTGEITYRVKRALSDIHVISNNPAIDGTRYVTLPNFLDPGNDINRMHGLTLQFSPDGTIIKTPELSEDIQAQEVEVVSRIEGIEVTWKNKKEVIPIDTIDADIQRLKIIANEQKVLKKPENKTGIEKIRAKINSWIKH